VLKKSAILGLVLLLVGGTVLGWVLTERRKERQRAATCKLKYGSAPDEYLRRYNEWLELSPEERLASPLKLDGFGQGKTKAELMREQQERLTADLDRLATGELDAYPFADVLYGSGWQDEVDKHRKQKEFNEFVLTGSVVCTSIGGTVFGSCVLLWMVRLLIGGASRLRRSSSDAQERREPAEGADSSHTGPMNSQQHREADDQSSEIPFVGAVAESSWRLAGKSAFGGSVGADSDRDDSEANPGAELDPAVQTGISGEKKSGSAKKRKKIPVRFAAEKTEKSQEGAAASAGNWDSGETETAAYSGPGLKAGDSALLTRQEGSVMLEESLKAKTESLEQQMEEFKRMAQNVRQTTLDHSKPLNNALKELTEQVSAIRDYASHQQERVEKLQDGYDWSIIRTFCLRVIRCIDNIEGRIEQLSEGDVGAEHLREVRDELVFALESSGVEQFKPEVNSLYRGQEKSTEAVKEREPCDDPEQSGKIARIVRPGYQYFMDEDNFKVVRAAQVKLFG
jgi:molecular chaperone GrpE (heat shock protein)